MPSYTNILAAVLALSAGSGTAHMIMKTPKPFGNPDNSPLSPSGANFPCKLQGDPKTFYDRTDVTTMASGSHNTLSFTGSAVHGGGSCQLAITRDLEPSASSTWEVILSIEGGCPSKDGTSSSTYDFVIPSGVPAGDYVFAWIWISKLSGNPEYYMNCAPIKVTGGSAKRSTNETLGEMNLFDRNDSLPNLFVANLASINDCKTTPETDVVFPDPGSNVIRPGVKNNFATVRGTCVPKGGQQGSSGGSASATSTADSGSGSGSDSTSATAQSVASSSAPADGPVKPTGFVTSTVAAQTSSVAAATPTQAATSEAASSQAAPTEAAPTEASSAAAAAPSSVGSSGAQSGPCTLEGMFSCDGKSYQQCASGSWTAMMPLAAGTICKVGMSSSLWARDANSGRFIRLD